MIPNDMQEHKSTGRFAIRSGTPYKPPKLPQPNKENPKKQ
jgi:hypothetical protein